MQVQVVSKWMVVAVCAAAVMAMLVGCSSQDDTADSAQQDAATSSSSELVEQAVVVGDGASTPVVYLVNNFDEDITGIRFVQADEAPQVDANAQPAAPGEEANDTAGSRLDIKGRWAHGLTAEVHYGVPHYASGACNMEINVGNASFVLHNVDFTDIEKAQIKLDESIPYLEYEKDGATVSTLDSEKAAREAEAAAAAQAQVEAEAAAAAQAEAEAAAAAQAEAEAAAVAQAEAETQAAEVYYEEPVYEEPVYEEPAYEESAAEVSQTEDQCVEGGVALRP